ncbi:MAG: cytochrome c-type biogenesis protein [Pseudomonadota bacterium]
MIAVLALLALLQTAAIDEERAQRLDGQLRCVVCQNQSIADSDAELANVMRALVRERMALGDSDEEVLAYVTDRYGEYVLLTPSRSAKNMVLWIGPALALAFGGALAFSVFQSSAKSRE